MEAKVKLSHSGERHERPARRPRTAAAAAAAKPGTAQRPAASDRARKETTGRPDAKQRELRAAIAELAEDGCDLTDPAINDGLRADDAAFHLSYLEECGRRRLPLDEVLDAAQAMMKAAHAAHAHSRHLPPDHPAWHPR